MPHLFEGDARTRPVTVKVVPERAIDRHPDGLTYSIPPDFGTSIGVGDRVLVPLGARDRLVPGIVVGAIPGGASDGATEDEIDPLRIKPVRRKVSHEAGLTADLIELARWIAIYYCCPLGSVLAAMVPAAVKRGTGRIVRVYVTRAEPTPATEVITGAAATGDGAAADSGQVEPAAAKPRRVTPAQKRIMAALDVAGPEPVEIHVLARQAGLKNLTAIRRLIDAGQLAASRRAAVEAAWDQLALAPEVARNTPTPVQQRVIDAIGADLKRGFHVHALYGVTGSGKTEIYLHLIERVLARGQGAIVLVPEIALTPQTVGRFLARFGEERIAVLHSGLTAAQRHEQWLAVREGRAKVVVGARSAVFAPFPVGTLGLIVVDEEHDGSYKQEQAPRYHARDVAIKRAHSIGATVVLGSATPSLETYVNATERGLYRWHELLERVPGATLPAVTVVDLQEELKRPPNKGRHQIRLIGPRLAAALRRALDAGGQAMLLLNRRGYANYISCANHKCGWVMTCDHCDVAMVFHKDRGLPRGGVVRCHHCLAEQRLVESCPSCGKRVVAFGMGTQRIEEELERCYPDLVDGATIDRMDADTMERAGDYHRALDRFRSGETRVLIGTQMIAKGLDFPNVRLVGVVNADTAIHLPDFRSGERTFQLISQVAGRCGRGEHAGEAVVQTFQPRHPAVRFAAAHDYHAFAALELEQRRRVGLPPIGRMARVIVRDKDHLKGMARAEALAGRLREIAREVSKGHGAAPPGPGASVAAAARRDGAGRAESVWVRGPAPAPLSRVADHHRIGLEVMAPTASLVQRVLVAARNEGLMVSDAKTAIDVDPVSLL